MSNTCCSIDFRLSSSQSYTSGFGNNSSNNMQVANLTKLAFFVTQALNKLYEKTTCQFQIKFITEDYLQMYKTLQIFTNTFTFITNKFTSIKVTINTWTGAKLSKMPSSLKLFLKLNCSLFLAYWNNVHFKLVFFKFFPFSRIPFMTKCLLHGSQAKCGRPSRLNVFIQLIQ